MRILITNVTPVVAIAIMAAAAVNVSAQNRPEVPDPGSVATLTAEIRLLRMAVEESTRSQTQTQALGVYLSVQQARLVQVAARVDAARKELDAVTLRVREVSIRLADMGTALQRVVDPAQRAELEEMTQRLRREQQGAVAQQQVAQTRDAELIQMLQAEEARWADLISRLEQSIRR